MQNLLLANISVEDIAETLFQKISWKSQLRKITSEPEDSTEELLTPDEAAKFLKCTTTNLWRLRKAETIKLYGLAGKRYYKKSELMNALQEVK